MQRRKKGKIKAMFNSIAGRYDLLNHILSAGVDIKWRDFATRHLIREREGIYLDVATGTADVAIKITNQAPEAKVIGVDFALKMLKIAKEKCSKRKIAFTAADALALPFFDNTFDGATIAFGIRNVEDRLLLLKEMTRVVKPKAKVVVLEFSMPKGTFSGLYSFYFKKILPLIGGVISGNKEAYQYLHDSVRDFLPPFLLCDMMAEAGLANIRYYPLTFGISICYVGEKR